MEHIDAGDYRIFIESKEWANLSKFLLERQYKKIFVLMDDNSIRHCWGRVEPLLKRYDYSVILLRHGEIYKTLESCEYIWTQLLKKGADRHSLLINLGGGVVSDLGGFAASVYKRGMDFINLPTTLLAQIDASVGGKTGVDWGGLKNMIGNFCNPQGVFILSGLLYTLSEREWKNGWVEGLKHGLLHSQSLWADMIGLWQHFEQKDIERVNGLLSAAIHVKKEIVAQDWEDKHLRQSLNIGHSIGHALEAWALGTEWELKHGEAVVLGLIAELNLSVKLAGADKMLVEQLLSQLRGLFAKSEFWLQWANKPLHLPELLPYLLADKKNLSGRIKMPLWVDFGRVLIGTTVETEHISWALGRLEVELRQF